MNTISLFQIQSAVDGAFSNAQAIFDTHAADASEPALARGASAALDDRTKLRTDIYTGPRGLGFAVVAQIQIGVRSVAIARQHGPETHRELPAPTLEALNVIVQVERAKRYEAEASVYDLADAETKLASPDTAMQAEGGCAKDGGARKAAPNQGGNSQIRVISNEL